MIQTFIFFNNLFPDVPDLVRLWDDESEDGTEEV